jgi:hypothetical protein
LSLSLETFEGISPEKPLKKSGYYSDLIHETIKKGYGQQIRAG